MRQKGPRGGVAAGPFAFITGGMLAARRREAKVQAAAIESPLRHHTVRTRGHRRDGTIGTGQPRRPITMREAGQYALSLLILLAFLWMGDAIAAFLRLPLPGSVVGMLLLAAALRLGAVRAAWVQPAAELLIRHMALLFVPAGVGLMVYGGVLRAEWLPIVAASVVSTVAVLGVVGWLQQRQEADG